ncbi:MAG: twin-arginine translocation signal domain-containing protein [Rubripirellula sp.]
MNQSRRSFLKYSAATAAVGSCAVPGILTATIVSTTIISAIILCSSVSGDEPVKMFNGKDLPAMNQTKSIKINNDHEKC